MTDLLLELGLDMAMIPPAKRARTFLTSPGPKAEPEITAIKDIKPDNKMRFCVIARVNFISMGGKTPKGEDIVKMEIRDSSSPTVIMKLTVLGQNNVAATKDVHINDIVKMRHLRCTHYDGENALIVGDKDPFSLMVVDDKHFAGQELPEADAPEVSGFDQLTDAPNGAVNVLAKIIETREELALY